MISTIFQGSNGDWDLSGGTLKIERRPYVVASTKIRNRLRIWLGEWFGDIRIGMPYVQKILVKNPDYDLIRRVFTDCILSMAPIIVEVTRLDLAQRWRDLYVYFEARADNDQIITGGFDGNAFILNQVQS